MMRDWPNTVSSWDFRDTILPAGVSLVSHPRISTMAAGKKQVQPCLHISHLEPLQAKRVLCSGRKCCQEKREETELSVGTRAAQRGEVIRGGVGNNEGWAVSGAWSR